MPPRAGADRQVQHLDRNQRRATKHVNRMRTPAGAPIEDDCGHEQQIGDQRRKQGYRDGWRSRGPGRCQKGKEPASHRRVQKRNRSKQHQPLVLLGRLTAAMDKANTTAKNRMPLSGTIAKAMPSSLSPNVAAVFIKLMLTSAPKMVIAVAKDIPIMPVERWFAILPEAASQVWKQKNKVQQKNTSP